MNASKLEQLIVDFVAVNDRQPTHVALSTQDFMSLQAEKYVPGIKLISLDVWKRQGTFFRGIPLIWKEGVLA